MSSEYWTVSFMIMSKYIERVIYQNITKSLPIISSIYIIKSEMFQYITLLIPTSIIYNETTLTRTSVLPRTFIGHSHKFGLCSLDSQKPIPHILCPISNHTESSVQAPATLNVCATPKPPFVHRTRTLCSVRWSWSHARFQKIHKIIYRLIKCKAQHSCSIKSGCYIHVGCSIYCNMARAHMHAMRCGGMHVEVYILSFG